MSAFAFAALLWRSHLPSLIEANGSSRASFGDPLGYLELAGALLAATAAIGLARRAGRAADPMMRSLAAGVSVLAIARLNYFLLPPVHSAGRLYAGDVLKLAAYLLILYGCMAEFRALQRKLVRRVAMDERRRMARDMHDGLAQEGRVHRELLPAAGSDRRRRRDGRPSTGGGRACAARFAHGDRGPHLGRGGSA